MSYSIMIVEDHEDMQLLYRAVFKKHPNLKIIAQEPSAESALPKIAELKPDIIIVDVSLPGMSGLEMTRQIHKLYPRIKILVVTAYERERYLDDAREAGADNLITKVSAFQVANEVEKMVG